MFDSQTTAALMMMMANEVEIDPAPLLAIAEVESGGRALFDVNGSREPAIRFEGHYFETACLHRLLARYAIRNRKPRAGSFLNARWA